jgi:DHA1 family bicyclomycin/chloramphenicol resistance-like MFS transporter
LKKTEFVVLTALLMSLVALAIDMILPALPMLAAEFSLRDSNDAQYVISAVFVGMIAGKLLFGPLSDAWGRKPAIYLGLALYIGGAIICYFAEGFSIFLLGRTIQGVGVAAPRVVSVALVRDQFEGREMARIMSFIMMVFILVPAIAPALGQGILLFFEWRMILGVFILTGVVSLTWFVLRQPETLVPEKRRPLAFSTVIAAVREVVSHPSSLGYSFAIGFVFAGFIGYLVSSQQIYDLIYHRGAQFPYYFGALALVIGSASIVNARFVVKYGMRKLSVWALLGIISFSSIAIVLELASPEPLSFELFIIFCIVAFFCIGVLFGNLNALAMEPLGHIAGTGSAVVGAGSTIISVVLGTLIGQAIALDVLPLLLGFLLTSLLTLGAFAWVGKKLEAQCVET